MALQVWLPLNGDLKNKGCADVTVTNNGAVIDNDGKIGKCYNFVEKSMTFPTPLNKTLYNFSVAGWVNLNQGYTLNYGFHIISFNQAYGRICISKDGAAVRVLLNNGNNIAVSSASPDSFVTYGVWHHYVVTFNNGTVCIYIDGELNAKRVTNVNYITYSVDNLTIGTYGGEKCNGKLNDFRLYDHCLSPKEVKEIAQGLVLHYKLDDPYLENTDNIDPCRNDLNTNKAVPTNLSRSTIDGTTVEIVNFAGYKCYKLTIDKDNVSSWWGCYILVKPLSFGASVGDTVTRSLMLYVPSGQTLPRSGNFEAIEGTSTNKKYHQYDYSKPDTWQRIWHTGTIADNAAQNNYIHYFCSLNAGQSAHLVCYFRDFQMEIKDHPTPYTNSSRNETSVHDSSGYGNNGEITGDLTISNDTPRYDNCIQNNSSYLLGSVFDFPESKGLTITGWVYVETRGYQVSGLWATSTNSTTNPNDYNQTTCSHTDTCFRMRGTDGNLYSITCNTQDVPLNTWKHIALTHDGTDIKLYIDGTFVRSISCPTSLVGFKSFWLGRANSNRYTQGKWSDFRIYATALSEEDVKQLYEVSGKIDKSGNLHSYEFNELHVGRELLVRNITNGYTSITSTYTNYSEEGIEFNGQSSAGSDYIEINPSTNKYIYDYTISVSTGNQFYIGFERYDENKTARSNQACVYTFAKKPTSDIVKQRYTGIVNLATDGVNPCKYIRLRILNGWTGTDSSSTKLVTIHNLSLREVPTSTTDKTKLYKTGIFESDLLLEGNTKVEVEKNLDANVNQLIEM